MLLSKKLTVLFTYSVKHSISELNWLLEHCYSEKGSVKAMDSLCEKRNDFDILKVAALLVQSAGVPPRFCVNERCHLLFILQVCYRANSEVASVNILRYQSSRKLSNSYWYDSFRPAQYEILFSVLCGSTLYIFRLLSYPRLYFLLLLRLFRRAQHECKKSIVRGREIRELLVSEKMRVSKIEDSTPLYLRRRSRITLYQQKL